MGGPYLESGESIVLTTDRVSIDTVMYQAMLTTRRLILIDSRNIRFEPQIISLSAIRTVRSGKAATGDPVIMLTLEEQGHPGMETRIIIFSQEPAENRKPDRDLWLKTFIELSVSSREQERVKEVPATEDQGGMRPSIRRWVAPDIIRPRTDNFPVKEPAPEISITPDEPEQDTAAEPEPAAAGVPDTGEDVPEEYSEEHSPDSHARAARTEVQSLTGPGDALPSPGQSQPQPDIPEPAVVAAPEPLPAFKEPDLSSPLSASILAAVQSLTGDNPQKAPETPVHSQKTGTEVPETYPEIPHEKPVRLTSSLPEDLDSHPVVNTTVNPVSPSPAEEKVPEKLHPEDDEITTCVRSTSQIPEIPPACPEVPDEPEFPQTPADTVPEEPEPALQPVMPESSQGEPAEELEGITTRPGEVPETSEITPASPPDSPSPPGTPGLSTGLMIGGIILCLLLLIAGILFLQGTGSGDSGEVTISPTPVMTMVPVADTAPASTVPANGTWVQIVSPGFFTGIVGNPDSLVQVSGSGERWFRVRDSSGLVKVSAEKQEYTGDELRVQVFTDGRLVTSRNTSAPQGSIDFLIDPATGEAPGIIETPRTESTRSRLEYL